MHIRNSKPTPEEVDCRYCTEYFPYQIVNETVKRELGGLHSAKVLLYSVDFAEIEEYQTKGEWDKSAEVLAEAAQNLGKAGAGFIIICTGRRPVSVFGK